MKFKTIPRPFCKTGHAHITYEENRVYQLNCPDCGNAVCPPLAYALVWANFPEWRGERLTTMADFENAVAV